MLRLLQRGPSLVGEVGWSRDTDDVSVQLDQATTSENIFHYAGGVRWTGHTGGRAWPYGQVHRRRNGPSSVSFDDDTLDETLGGSATRTRLIIQPGVGLTLVGGDGWGVLGQVDYRRLLLKEDEDGAAGRNDVRLFLGLRVILD